jgi:hypothetical protein
MTTKSSARNVTFSLLGKSSSNLDVRDVERLLIQKNVGKGIDKNSCALPTAYIKGLSRE